mmetsp:Transcript_97910/g.301871  ORF Transcript_97910/g.301871 Transcript_97910/m.301871 type:complete len:233 (-) Transcript_97910:655-1353(-)
MSHASLKRRSAIQSAASATCSTDAGWMLELVASPSSIWRRRMASCRGTVLFWVCCTGTTVPKLPSPKSTSWKKAIVQQSKASQQPRVVFSSSHHWENFSFACSMSSARSIVRSGNWRFRRSRKTTGVPLRAMSKELSRQHATFSSMEFISVPHVLRAMEGRLVASVRTSSVIRRAKGVALNFCLATSRRSLTISVTALRSMSSERFRSLYIILLSTASCCRHAFDTRRTSRQ